MFNNSTNIDASHSTFSEVHRDQYYNVQSTVQGDQTINTIIHGNQILQDSRSNLIEVLQKASASSAAHDSAQRYPAPKCIEGTRVELLSRITSWVDEQDEKPICWLNGRPGSGKSAVSQTIAEEFANQKRLAASFFFSRRDLERRTTQHVVSTLTIQLLVSLPSIRPAVIAALENDYMVPMKVLREQMEKLLLEPLSTATEIPEKPILIILDALDECDDTTLVAELVTLVALLPRKTTLPLRLMITSRSEPWLQSQFHRPDMSAITHSLEIHTFSAEADIRSFLRRALDDTYDQHLQVMEHLPRPWPSSDKLERIVNKAGGLFIFALTVAKFVGDRTHNPVDRLQAILEDKATVSTGSAYADLDSLYRDAISVFPDTDVARLVLGVVYCMAIPLSASGLYKLLRRSDVDVRVIVPALSSVLLPSEDGKQPIRFYHASFRDFLVDPLRSQKYAINPDVYHRLMAQLCFETMSTSLKRDMCDIGNPAKANSEVVDLAERRQVAFDEALLYACRFWSSHLTRLPNDGIANEALLSALKRFSTTALLYWIEAFSIFGELESAVVMLREGISWLKTLREIPTDTLTLFEDAEHLIVGYMECLSKCALHLYVTALSFAPPESAIYKTYQHQSLGTLTIHPDRTQNWSDMRRVIDLHTPIHSIVFSPCGDTIATAGVKQGVQVWNVITGGNVASFGDRSSTSLLVRFSLSGAYLAAAFEDGVVAIWDPKVGREHLKHEGSHTEPITCLEFSMNSSLLASGSRDHAIQVWSVETAQSLYRLASHEGPVTSLVFSSDSQRLFSGSEDNLVIIWDMLTGKVVRGMMGHRKPVNCLAVSRDGRLIASGSEDKTIKMWDAGSGKCIETFKDHRTAVQSVHFFDGDKRLVTACNQAIISWTIGSRSKPSTIWAAEQFLKTTLKRVPMWRAKVIGWGTPTPVMRLFIDKIFDESSPQRTTISYASKSPSFVFTHRGFLHGGSLPNPAHGVPLGGSTSVTVASISSDGSWAATADSLSTFQIVDLSVPCMTWDEIEVAAKANPLRTAGKVIPSSTGMRFMVNASSHWYLCDGDYHVVKKMDMGMLEVMRDDDDIRFKFSPDGRFFFCVISSLFSDDKSTVRVFDADGGEERTQFSGLKKVHAFVASCDGAWFACGHGPGQVDVFEVPGGARTGMHVGGNASPIGMLVFSDDGDARWLVGGSHAGIVHVWNRASGACTATLQTSESQITALAYALTALHPNSEAETEGAVKGTENIPSREHAAIAIGRADGSVSIWYPPSPSPPSSRTPTSPSTVTPDSPTVLILHDDQAPQTKNINIVRFSDNASRLVSKGEDGVVCTWAIPPAIALVPAPAERGNDSGTGNKDADDADAQSARLLARSDPEEALDGFFHTAYRVRKDGWLVEGERLRAWLPTSIRPRGKDALFAYKSGLVVFFTPSEILVFLKLSG